MEGEFEATGQTKTSCNCKANVSSKPVETRAYPTPNKQGDESIPNRSFHISLEVTLSFNILPEEE